MDGLLKHEGFDKFVEMYEYTIDGCIRDIEMGTRWKHKGV